MLAITQIMHHAGEVPPTLRTKFGNRKVKRENRAVLAATTYLTANSDDLLNPGGEIIGKKNFRLVRFRHQHLHVGAHQLRRSVSEQPLSCGVYALDEPF